jgi:hypothetical protein
MPRTLQLIAALLTAGLLLPGAADARKLLPVDEGRRNPLFFAFRQRLVKALRTGDRRTVLSLVSPRVQYGLSGPEVGITGFRELWGLDEPGDRGWLRLRDALLTALSRGGSFNDGVFWAPYVYSRWPADIDWITQDGDYGFVCVPGVNVAAHERPEASSPVVARLSHDIVKIPMTDGFRGTEAWMPVITPQGRRAYVPGRSLASPSSYRACFTRVKGVWKLTELHSGD